MVTSNLGFESDPDRNRTCDLRFRKERKAPGNSRLIGEFGRNWAEFRHTRHDGATAVVR